MSQGSDLKKTEVDQFGKITGQYGNKIQIIEFESLQIMQSCN